MNKPGKLALPKGCLWGIAIAVPIWLLILYLIVK